MFSNKMTETPLNAYLITRSYNNHYVSFDKTLQRVPVISRPAADVPHIATEGFRHRLHRKRIGEL